MCRLREQCNLKFRRFHDRCLQLRPPLEQAPVPYPLEEVLLELLQQQVLPEPLQVPRAEELLLPYLLEGALLRPELEEEHRRHLEERHRLPEEEDLLPTLPECRQD